MGVGGSLCGANPARRVSGGGNCRRFCAVLTGIYPVDLVPPPQSQGKFDAAIRLQRPYLPPRTTGPAPQAIEGKQLMGLARQITPLASSQATG